tara:strand:+ start:804 stop:2525 length:1722 start_codon:yes stop_codon:yes gene_type:complete
MALTLQIKRSTGTNAPGSLADGELAYTHGTGTAGNNGDRLFIGDGSTVNVIGGQFFSDMLDHTQGTLTASSAITVDSNKAVDDFIIGNNASTGGSLQIKEGTNNGTHHVQLKAPNALSGNVEFTLPSADGSADQFLKTNGSGTLSFGAISTSFTLAADSGSNDTFNTGETLTFFGGEGIDTSVANNAITITGEDATASNKGIASFASADFDVSSGAVSIKSGGVSSTQLAGSIANSKLANSSVTIGSDAVALGGTQTDINGLTSLDVDNLTLDGNTVSSTNSNGNIVLDPNGTGTVDVSSAKITSVASPSADTDAATKGYVDGVVNGLDVKKSVDFASTANVAGTYNNGAGTITASSNGALSMDGGSPSNGQRVLLKDQSSNVQNGVYVVTNSGGAGSQYVLTRAADADANAEISGGAFFFVEQGSANADNGFVTTHNGTPTLGTDAITFEQFSGAGQISAGSALTKSGNTLNVAVDDSSIEINSDALRVKASGITNAMLAGSIDLTAKVTGALPVGNGGTGLSSIAKGSVLVANSANTLSALDGGGSNDGFLAYTASSDTLSFATSIDGGTF